MARLPTALVKKRAILAYERQALATRLKSVTTELAALDYAPKTISPAWSPPRRIRKPQRRSMLRKGVISKECLLLLREQGALDSRSLTRQIAERNGLDITTTAAQQSLGSAVAMTLRRDERRGLIRNIARDQRTGILTWQLCAGPFAGQTRLRVV